DEQIGGLRRFWIQSTASIVDETSILDNGINHSSDKRNYLVLFRGESDYFRPLNGWNCLLKNKLKKITKQRWMHRVENLSNICIGIHVRRGDFAEASSSDDFASKGGLRTPLSWYSQCLNTIRHAVGMEVPA